MTIKVIRYQSLNEGPTLVMLGAVHGNEFCGTLALNRLAELFDSGAIKLTAGQLIMIPITNPRAYQEKKRFIDRNLNRRLYPKSNPTAYEDLLDPILCPILEQADVLLDLHSYGSEGGPFVFLSGLNAKETEYARHLGVDHFVHGWQNAYRNAEVKEADYEADKESMGTTEYARLNGALAITLECGHHINPDAPNVGLTAALSSLKYFGLIDSENPVIAPGFYPEEPSIDLTQLDQAKQREHQKMIGVQQVYYKDKPGQLAKQWKHLDPVSEGEVIAQYTEGDSILAPEAGFILLPKIHNGVGQEWFYFGIEQQPPC